MTIGRVTSEISIGTRLVFVRHGQTPWNVAGIWQGQADPGLTDAGLAQAREVAARLAAERERGWRRIVSSDLQRARLTAEAIAEAVGAPLSLEPRLRERDVRDWSGLTQDEVARRDPETLAAFRRGDPSVRPGGGESTHDVRARALAVVAELVRDHPGEHLIVVTHLGLIRTLVPDADASNAGRTEVSGESLLERVATTGARGTVL